MTPPLDIMTDEEVNRSCEDEAGFGSLRTPRGHLPLKAMEITGRITGLISEVALRQTFVNTHDEPMEATYVYPLPSRAAVTSFRLEVAGRVVEGVIKERQAARQEYDQAIRQGHRAAITEEERPGVFSMRVGNLMPGEEAAVRITLTGPLPCDRGEATFRFPLVVAPRYIPGQPLAGGAVGDGVAADTGAVPDASRISPPVLLPGYPNPVRLGLSLTVDPAGLEFSRLRSSLHVVRQRQEGSYLLLTLEPGQRLDRDFILRFAVGQDAVHSGLALVPDAEGDQGTFQLTLVPPDHVARTQKPRDVIFVLDRSGSMGGWKMVAARRATARMVDTLAEQDRFAVYAFDNVVETPPGLHQELVPATDRNRFGAVEFLARLEARGGTEMAGPLEASTDRLGGGYQDRERIMVLITDGQVGNEDQILRALAPRLGGIRIFTLGIDRAVNEGFLQRLAALGAGCFELVESEDRLDQVMDKIHRRIGTPVLTELQLRPDGLELIAGSMVPARIPDLFASAPLMIMGRYRGAASGAFALAAADAAGGKWSEQIHGRPGSGSATASVWARGQIRELEDQYVLERGDRAQLERRILETSLRHSVLCRFTAYVAVDRAEKVNPGGKQHQVLQPVEMPDGWEMFDAEASPSMTRAGQVLSGQPLGIAPCAAQAPGGPPLPSLAPAQHTGPSPSPKRRRSKSSMDLARPSSPGLLHRALEAFCGAPEMECEEEALVGMAPLDLAPYHGRAAELLREFLKQDVGTPTQRLASLGYVTGKLDQLIEDLESAGAPEDQLEPLVLLLSRLRRFLGTGSQDPDQLDQQSRRLRQVLEQFCGQSVSGPTPSPPPTRDRGKGPFWK